jgi:hypothetical protein
MIVETVKKRCQWCRSWMDYEKRNLDSLSPFMSYALAFYIMMLDSVDRTPQDSVPVWVCPSCGRMEEAEF